LPRLTHLGQPRQLVDQDIDGYEQEAHRPLTEFRRSSANCDNDVKASGLLFGFNLDNEINIISDRTQKSIVMPKSERLRFRLRFARVQ
jgi:hypothetical protein